MKVMCINDNWVVPKGVPEKGECPTFGEVCNVIGVDTMYEKDWYSLKEYKGLYRTDHFAPLSDIDGVEILEYEDRFIRHGKEIETEALKLFDV